MSKAKELSELGDAVTVDSGNVGIGVSPTSNLHIGASGNDDKNEIRIDGTNGSGQTFGYIMEADGENGRVSFKVGQANATPTQKLMIHPDGGICFGTDTAAANALDDYEEGTWTPSFAGTGYAFSNQSGTYTKIGRQVFVRCKFDITTVGSNTSQITFSGLPFASSNDITNGHFEGLVRETTSNGAIFAAQVNSGTTSGGVNSMDGITSGDNHVFTVDTYALCVTYEV